jgi:exosome complex component CSL4
MGNIKAVVPGETLTTEEEFLAGKNTFTEDGFVKASTFGEANFDHNTKEVQVNGKSIGLIQEGDVVYGVVTMVKESSVVVRLTNAENGKKILQTSAQIPIRLISNEFVSKARDFYRIGDVIKARIAKLDPLGTDLETKGQGLGVVIAYCSNCRHEMSFSTDKMMCISCGNSENRKWFEKTDEYKPRPRSEFDSNRSFSDRGRSYGNTNRSYGSENRNFGGGNRSFGNNNRGPRDGNRSFGNNNRSYGDSNSGPREGRSFDNNKSFNSNGRENFRG